MELRVFLVLENKLIVKVKQETRSVREGSVLVEKTTDRAYLLWWRLQQLNWPAVTSVKMPTKFYKACSRRRRVYWYSLVFRNSQEAPTVQDMQNRGVLLQTDNLVELLSYISSNSYPDEIVDFFLQQI
jgi:hypothetical protein